MNLYHLANIGMAYFRNWCFFVCFRYIYALDKVLSAEMRVLDYNGISLGQKRVRVKCPITLYFLYLIGTGTYYFLSWNLPISLLNDTLWIWWKFWIILGFHEEWYIFPYMTTRCGLSPTAQTCNSYLTVISYWWKLL